MSVLESTLEGYAVEKAEERGFLVFKLNNPASDGWPDRQMIAPDGAHFYIEFKRFGEKCRKLQSWRIMSLLDFDQEVYVVDCKEQVNEILAYYARCNGMEAPPVSRTRREDHDSAVRGGPLVGSGFRKD